MSLVKIMLSRDAVGASNVNTSSVGQVTIRSVTDASSPFTFPFAPNNISVEGLNHEYEELERPGRKPLVQFSRPKPVSMTLKTLVTAETGRGFTSAEPAIQQLVALAQSQSDLIVVGLGVLISGLRYRITDLSIDAKRLNPEQEITMADVTVQFTETLRFSDKTIPGMARIKDVVIPITAEKKGSSKKGGGGTKPSGVWEKISPYIGKKQNEVAPSILIPPGFLGI